MRFENVIICLLSIAIILIAIVAYHGNGVDRGKLETVPRSGVIRMYAEPDWVRPGEMYMMQDLIQ